MKRKKFKSLKVGDEFWLPAMDGNLNNYYKEDDNTAFYYWGRNPYSQSRMKEKFNIPPNKIVLIEKQKS